MILNLTKKMAEHLLVTVDQAAEDLLRQIPKTRNAAKREELILHLKCLGGVKHRLHWGLGLESFRGPIEWGYPIEGGELY